MCIFGQTSVRQVHSYAVHSSEIIKTLNLLCESCRENKGAVTNDVIILGSGFGKNDGGSGGVGLKMTSLFMTSGEIFKQFDLKKLILLLRKLSRSSNCT